MKAQLIRTVMPPYADLHEIDLKWVEGTMGSWPEVGKSATFYFAELKKGYWFIANVRKVLRRNGSMVVCTERSEYIIKRGWKE